MKALGVLLMLALASLGGIQAQGQRTSKIKIYVNCTCDDVVGTEYATALKDAIARSPRYTLAFSGIEGSEKDMSYNWTLSIVSVEDTGTSTAISVVLALGDIMFSQRVQTCGSNVVEHCAAMTLAGMDGDIDKLRKK